MSHAWPEGRWPGSGPVELLFRDVLAGPRDLDRLEHLLDAQYLDHTAPDGTAGRDGVRHRLRVLRCGFPDVLFTLDDLVVQADTVAARWHWRGTHEGEYLGFAPTGRRVTARGMDFYRLARGRIAEHWDVIDLPALCAQLEAASARRARGAAARS